MQRILHFAQDGDTSGFFPQLARWHDRSRYQMLFGTLNPIAPWLRDYMESQGVRCFSCDCRFRSEYPRGLIKLARFLRRERVDILHTHLFEPSVIGLHAGGLAATPLRVMTRPYSDYHTRVQKKWHVRMDQRCTRLSDAIIAVSRHTAVHMIETEGAPSNKVHVVLNGIDFERVELSGPDARERVRRENADDDAYLLLIVARLHPEKGHHYLFEALPEVRRRVNRPVRLLVAGTGPFDSAYKEEVRALGCEDIVSFLGFRKDSADLMAAADLLILPSVAEAFGLVLAEAIYLGTPVIATRAGGIPEIVDDGVDGVLVAPADTKALADAIVDLLNNPEKRRRLAGAGREKITASFRFQEMVGSYEAVYAKLSSRLPEGAHARSLGDHSHV
ncbi:MAG: glycosyltransferase [Blastocatellia bacterium]